PGHVSRTGARGRPALSAQLCESAIARILVLAPAPQLGAVTDAASGDVVEVDLHDELRPQSDPLQIAPGAPAARVGRAALARLVRREEPHQPPLLGRAQARAVPDDAQLRPVVQA